MAPLYTNKEGVTTVSKFAWCKVCCTERWKQYRKANPEKIKGYAHRTKIRKGYGVEPEQYEAMGEEQGWVCAICGKPSPEGFRLAVDHDHSTHKVRGLLCSSCNQGLGRFKDNPELLMKAIEYLRRNYTPPSPPKPKRKGRPRKPPNYCIVPGCGRVTPYKEYCQKHYFRLKRTGSVE